MNVVRQSLLRDLLCATEENEIERVEELIRQGLKVDEAEELSKKSPFFVAAEEGHVELLRLMIPHAKNPDSPEYYGATPLAYVVHELGASPVAEKRDRLLATLKLLLEVGADPGAGSDKYQTPVVLCREYGMLDLEGLFGNYAGTR